MVFAGLALLFAGYSAGLYGWILIKGYNVSFMQLFTGPWPPQSAKASPPASATQSSTAGGSGVPAPTPAPPGGNTTASGGGSGTIIA